MIVFCALVIFIAASLGTAVWQALQVREARRSYDQRRAALEPQVRDLEFACVSDDAVRLHLQTTQIAGFPAPADFPGMSLSQQALYRDALALRSFSSRFWAGVVGMVGAAIFGTTLEAALGALRRVVHSILATGTIGSTHDWADGVSIASALVLPVVSLAAAAWFESRARRAMAMEKAYVAALAV